jgi:hypothetical protein
MFYWSMHTDYRYMRIGETVKNKKAPTFVEAFVLGVNYFNIFYEFAFKNL